MINVGSTVGKSVGNNTQNVVVNGSLVVNKRRLAAVKPALMLDHQ